MFSDSAYGWDKPLSAEPKRHPSEEKRVKKSASGFEAYCKWASKTFPAYAASEKPLDSKVQDAFNFLGWEITPGEYNAGAKAASIFGVAFALAAFASGYYLFGQDLTLLTAYAAVGMGAIFLIPYLVKNTPISAAEKRKKDIMIEIPRIVGYMGMSMKLSPNLERAIAFAAEHGEGKIAESFRELLWNSQTGVYSNLEEGLDEMAYNWGKYSPEFKQALMTIRSSVLEPDETHRNILLDSALEDSLTSIGNKLSDRATSLKGPSMIMFYLGVLLPLILIIVLPIGAVLGGNTFFSNLFVLAGIYNVGIPVVLYIVAMAILAERPPVYEPPEIPDDHPELPRKGMVKIGKTQLPMVLLLLVVGGAALGATYFLHLAFDPSFGKIVKDQFGQDLGEYLRTHDEKTVQAEMKKYDLVPFILIGGATLGSVLVACTYLYFSSIYKRRVQLEVIEMEEEFKDSAYLIASRLGQNKPVEDAIKYVGEFLPESKLATRVFGKVRQNITLLGLTLEGAVFDPLYGALRNIPSKLIYTSMKIIVDAVQLGVNVAARAVMALSNQLTAFSKINRQITTELSEVTATMQSMGGFIGPIVLGITTALQKIITNTINASIAGAATGPSLPEGVSVGGINFQNQTQLQLTEAGIDPTWFLVILIVYVVQMVTILTYFGGSIKEGKNKLVTNILVAQTLPISITLFLITAFVAKHLIGLGG